MNKLTINNFGIIASANIEINQINVIGGVNSTGKSTSSKLFYCFLRSNCSSRQDLAFDSLYNKVNSLEVELSKFVESVSSLLRYGVGSKNFDLSEWFSYINREMNNNKIYNYSDMNFKDLYNYFINLKKIYNKVYNKIVKNDINFSYYKDKPLSSDFSSMSNAEINYFNVKKFNLDYLNSEILKLDSIFQIVLENGGGFFNFVFKKLFKIEFPNNFFSKNSKIQFDYDLAYFEIKNNLKINNKGFFEINNVYYLDSFSIFDLNRYTSDIEHIKNLSKDLKCFDEDSCDLFDEMINKKIIDLEKKIFNIINGKFVYKDNKFQYSLPNGDFVDMMNTASGIKQIAIIQMLLANRKLNEDSFLIIDEPEVNLHPKWQVKFAEILVLLSNELNITLYINSHSPMFIEAIDTFSQIYDLEDKTNYYLTYESEIPNKFNINKIDSNELYVLYDNLGEPYDYLDKLKLKNNIN